ncbi:glycoside hydrolase [Nibricoccus aquaticus]|uniref:Glycoside hydrolase n=1 Tax=Nibricoccus aquaticus TaxID=2576891 RepID=A0A290QGL2_9BACT|nr:glycoside hydrolase family 28 protein [Nibricoccus aquaticus]ATC64468.1 glycoside hydrolase [Nibricoccus aquaticus]
MPRLFSVFLALAFLSAAPLHAALTKPVSPIAPAAPKIPSTRVSLADFGGKPDGITLNTDAFARAIAALSEKGGGTLFVPPGIWHTGPIALKSRINLHLEAGALVQFSRDTTLYPLRHFKARSETFVDSTSPLSGDNLEDIAITGSGVIDGGGDAWRLVKKAKMTEGAWNALVKSGGVLNDKKNEWWPSQAALEGGAAIATLEKKGSIEIADYAPYQIFLRPRMVRLLDCKRVLIEGVTVRNAPNWTLHPWLCEDLAIRDVKIFNNRWAQNSDAMDIDSCRRVHIKGCIVDTGDDGICIKSGINESGRRIGVPTEDVLVEDCVVYEGHGGFTIGSEMSGGVRNILVQNCTFIGTALGLRFKTSRGRGGLVENIHMRGIRMTHIEGNAIDFNFFYWVQGQPQPTAPAVDEGTPQFRNMLFEDITARDGSGTLVLRGLPEMPINNLTFRNVTLAGGKGADIANSDKIVFENVRIENKTGDALTTTAVTNSKLELAR